MHYTLGNTRYRVYHNKFYLTLAKTNCVFHNRHHLSWNSHPPNAWLDGWSRRLVSTAHRWARVVVSYKLAFCTFELGDWITVSACRCYVHVTNKQFRSLCSTNYPQNLEGNLFKISIKNSLNGSTITVLFKCGLLLLPMSPIEIINALVAWK